MATAAPAVAPLPANPGIEVRHMYLFQPGKKAVLIVQREGDNERDTTSTQEISAEPPEVR